MNARELSQFARRFRRLGTAWLLILVVTGCDTAHEYSLTYKLWDKGTGPSCRPALEPKLEVFASQLQPDLLVSYDALDERADKILRRAYFLHTNEMRVTARLKPFYVEPSLATNMHAVPIVIATNEIKQTGPTVRYPVNTDYGLGFELYRDGHREGEHPLPVYYDGISTPARVALTPLAVTGDTIMVGLVTGAVAALGWISVGCPPFANQY
jgi:hypothetical protein